MSQKTPLQDSNSEDISDNEILNSYRDAAECDEFMFGDYDYCKEWIGMGTCN